MRPFHAVVQPANPDWNEPRAIGERAWMADGCVYGMEALEDRGGRVLLTCDLSARPRALAVLTLLSVRNATGELDHFKAALNVALGIGDDLAMLDRDHLRQSIHIPHQQALEFLHYTPATLRINRGPARLRFAGNSYCMGDVLVARKPDPSLNLPTVRIKNITKSVT